MGPGGPAAQPHRHAGPRERLGAERGGGAHLLAAAALLFTLAWLQTHWERWPVSQWLRLSPSSPAVMQPLPRRSGRPRPSAGPRLRHFRLGTAPTGRPGEEGAQPEQQPQPAAWTPATLGFPAWTAPGAPQPRAELLRQVVQELTARQWEKTFDLRPVKQMVQRSRNAPAAAGEQQRRLRQAAKDLLGLVLPAVKQFSAWDVCQTLDVLVDLNSWDAVFRFRLAADVGVLVDALCRQLVRPDVLPKLTGRQGSRVIAALARMGRRKEDTVRALMLQMMQQPLSAADVSRVLWALVKVENANPELLSMLAYQLVHGKALEEVNGRSAANIAWAFARLEVNNPELMTKLAAHVLATNLVNEFAPQDLANMGWACAKLGFLDPALMAALSQRALSPGFLQGVEAPEIANTAWAFAKLGLRDEPLLAALADRIMDGAVLATFIAQDLATTAWAYAKLGVRNRALMSALAVQSVEPTVMDTLNAQDLATLTWAFATLGIHSDNLMMALSGHMLQGDFLRGFNAQGLATTAWAYAKLGILDEPLMTAIAERALAPGFLATFSAQNRANLAWAYDTLGHKDDRLRAALAEHQPVGRG